MVQSTLVKSINYKEIKDIDEENSPYVISKYDGHPNAEGHKRLAAAIYKFIKEK